jgi:hypothetical protein
VNAEAADRSCRGDETSSDAPRGERAVCSGIVSGSAPRLAASRSLSGVSRGERAELLPVHILAAVAEHKMIPEPTKAASGRGQGTRCQARRRPRRPSHADGTASRLGGRMARADAKAADYAPVIADLRPPAPRRCGSGASPPPSDRQLASRTGQPLAGADVDTVALLVPRVLMPRVLNFLMTTAEARRALATARGGIRAFVWIAVLRRTPRSRRCGIDEAHRQGACEHKCHNTHKRPLVAEPRGHAVRSAGGSMNVRGRMRQARSMSRPIHAAMPRGHIARSQPGISWGRHHPSRLPGREQGRIRRLSICLWRRKDGGADGKHDSDYCETDHGMFLCRLR